MNHQSVQQYYGETLQGTEDLQTDACCTPSQVPAFLKRVLSNVHDDVLARYYGCGLIAPEVLQGARILDLGCGAGRDVYALAQLVGESGHVVGVDMTPAQLAVARRHEAGHAERFGFAAPNTQFVEGYIEKLEELGLEPGSFDIVVSNCVLNLATDKAAVLAGVAGLLKEGGEMYFSDVYASRRVPASLREDEVLYGECLSGGLYRPDFEAMARGAGFADPRVVESRPLGVENPAIQARLGLINFESVTYRLFKLPKLEAGAEDYGQAVRYKGTAENLPLEFALDAETRFETGRIVPVSGNTFRMLQTERFAPHFDLMGSFCTHYGAFDGAGAGEAAPVMQSDAEPAGCCG